MSDFSIDFKIDVTIKWPTKTSVGSVHLNNNLNGVYFFNEIQIEDDIAGAPLKLYEFEGKYYYEEKNLITAVKERIAREWSLKF